MQDLISMAFGAAERVANIRGPKTTIRVAKGYCTPSRDILSGAFNPLGIRFQAPLFDTRANKDPDTGLPTHQEATITVSKKQAVWAEYVILSIKTPSGQPVFRVLSKPKAAKNAAWAEKRSGVPMPWNLDPADAGWATHDCPEAKAKGAQNGSGKNAAVKGHGGILFTRERNGKAKTAASPRHKGRAPRRRRGKAERRLKQEIKSLW